MMRAPRETNRSNTLFHCTTLFRSGGVRQEGAAREDARRPLAAVRQPEAALRLDVVAPRQEAALHGRGIRPVERVEPRPPARLGAGRAAGPRGRSEEHTSELQSLMRNSYPVFCLKKKTNRQIT